MKLSKLAPAILSVTVGCGVACPDGFVREGDLCTTPGVDGGADAAAEAGVDAAVDSGFPPDAALPDASSDAPAARYISGSDNTPVFHWPPTDGAVEYELWVGDENSQRVYQLKVPASVCGPVECTTEPSTALASGPGVFWTRSFDASSQFSEWSEAAYFNVP